LGELAGSPSGSGQSDDAFRLYVLLHLVYRQKKRLRQTAR